MGETKDPVEEPNWWRGYRVLWVAAITALLFAKDALSAISEAITRYAPGVADCLKLISDSIPQPLIIPCAFLLFTVLMRTHGHKTEKALWTALENARRDSIPRIWHALRECSVTVEGRALTAADVFWFAGHGMSGHDEEEMITMAASIARLKPESFKIAWMAMLPFVRVHDLWENIYDPSRPIEGQSPLLVLRPHGRDLMAYGTTERARLRSKNRSGSALRVRGDGT